MMRSGYGTRLWLLVLVALGFTIGATGAADGGLANFQDGGDRLANLQNDDGGWDWPLDDGDPTSGSAANIIGPIGMGLSHAYTRTNDPNHLAALNGASGYLLAKSGTFTVSDGYLAGMLDNVLGGSAHTAHVKTNFFDKLTAGTYVSAFSGTTYDTDSYIAALRDPAYGNTSGWSLGRGGISADVCGAADTNKWVQATKDEIDELDSSASLEVLGLAGGLYGLAYLGEDFDPTSGSYASASNLEDLADILAGYQISTGGWTKEDGDMTPNQDEAVQETVYGILALGEVGGYKPALWQAGRWLRSVQLGTGGWENIPGDGENNQHTGEALWGLGSVPPIPEPGAAGLLLAGLALRGLRRRRR
ncbi:MAG: hypothetical protein ACOC8E_01055 [Planctomycetota bacterium]